MRLSLRLIPFIYMFISIIINFAWFKENAFLAGAEMGLAFMDYEKEFWRNAYLWQDHHIVGFNDPSSIFSIPLVSFGYFLSFCNLSGLTIQRLLFGAIFALNGIGMYFLTLYFLKGRSESYLCAFIAGLFYMFNTFSFLSTWNRFIYGFIMMSPVLPLSLLFYVRFLNSNKIINLYLLLVIFIIFTYAFLFPSNLFIIIFLLGAYFLFYCYNNRVDRKKLIRASLNSIFLSVSVIITCLWWLVPFLSSSGHYVQSITTDDNIASLKAISQHFPLSMVIRGINPTVLYTPDYWGKVYSNNVFEIISFIPFFVIVTTFFVKIRERIVWFFGFLTLLTLFVMKGTNPPFGSFLIWLFEHFYVLNVFRNPYEKFGLLWPLCYSFLFGYGIGHFYYWMKQKLEHLEINKRSFYNYFPQEIAKKICNNFKEYTVSKPKY